VSVCLSVPHCIPTLVHGPGYNFGNGRGVLQLCTIVQICNRYMGFVADNIAPNTKCQRVLVLTLCLVMVALFLVLPDFSPNILKSHQHKHRSLILRYVRCVHHSVANAFKMSSPFSDACETPPHLTVYQVSQHLLLFKQVMDGLYLPVCRYTAAVDFIEQACSAQHLLLQFP